jgi:L-amino acid N-acyltransferase YncA
MSFEYDPAGAFLDRERKICLLSEALSTGSTSVFRRGERRFPLEIRLCGRENLDEILSLQQKVYESLSDKDTFVQTTKEELAESLDEDFCIGAFSGDSLTAFTLMIINRATRRNLAYLFDDTEQSAQTSVVYDTTFVDPVYVGCGLQRYFITLKDKLAVRLGAVRAYATVSPDNAFSLSNMTANGFKTLGKKQMYGGYWRCILCKRLV